MQFFQIFFLIITLANENLFGQDYSLAFDGDGDYVRIPDHSDLDFTEDYTI